MEKITIFALTLDVGGIEKYTANLCEMLEQDYEIELICTYKVREEPAFPFSKKIKITYLIDEKPNAVSLKKLLQGKHFIRGIKEVARRVKLKYLEQVENKKVIEKLDCDYLITTRIFHDKLIHKYLKNKNIITIATDHNYHQNNKKYIRDLVTSVRSFDYLVLSTQELCDFYKPMLPNTKCIFMPNALDSISGEKVNFKGKNFISVGRLSPEKGFLDLIDVFQIIHQKDKKVKLYLLGDGYQKEELENKIKSLHLEKNIIMPGFVVGEDQKKYYFDSSVYLMTSITECFGLVLIEAMNYGLPCIAFDSASGARALINKKVGVLIKNRNKEKMAEEALKLRNDQKRLKSYQKNINEYIYKFDKETIKKEWLKILRKR